VVSFPTSAQATAGPGTRVALTSRQEAARPLRIWFREMARGSTDRPASRWQCLARLRDLGRKTKPLATGSPSPEDATVWQELSGARRDTPAYEIDGCLFKVDDLADQARLGVSPTGPRWAVAWRFPARQRAARICAIRAQVGRTGALTPVADLEPGRIGRVEATRLSLSHLDEIDRQEIRAGEHVIVERAGGGLTTGTVTSDGRASA
jgi:DNA ligase (NAD+)